VGRVLIMRELLQFSRKGGGGCMQKKRERSSALRMRFCTIGAGKRIRFCPLRRGLYVWGHLFPVVGAALRKEPPGSRVWSSVLSQTWERMEIPMGGAVIRTKERVWKERNHRFQVFCGTGSMIYSRSLEGDGFHFWKRKDLATSPEETSKFVSSRRQGY